MRAVDDVDLRRRDPELLGALVGDPLDPRELPLGDANGAPEQLPLPDLLPEPYRARDRELDWTGGLDGGPGLTVEDERIVELACGGASCPLGLPSCDVRVEVERRGFSHSYLFRRKG